ncbi:MAG: DUF2380 domain-containing protein [Spirochaetes bacterium]|nr:DUF2380 domain-containing protein [Spirochaetota bacterium]
MSRKSYIKLIIILCLVPPLFVLHAAAYGQADGKPRKRVAVLNFSAENVEESTTRIVRNNIELSLFDTKKFDILEQQQIEDILKEKKLILTQCRDEICAGDIGDMLSAEYVVIGNVSKLDTMIVHVKVIDIETRKIVIADSIDIRDISDIRNASGELSRDLADRIENYGRKGISFSVSASFNYMMPLGFFADKTGPGYGIIVSGRAEDIFFKRFILGVDTGAQYFNEKPGVTHHSIFIPALCSIGYRIPLHRDFSIVPEISGGASYDTVYYYNAYKEADYTKNSSFQPTAKAGAAVEYRLPLDFLLRLGAEYGSIFEQDGRLEFLSFTFGAGAEF